MALNKTVLGPLVTQALKDHATRIINESSVTKSFIDGSLDTAGEDIADGIIQHFQNAANISFSPLFSGAIPVLNDGGAAINTKYQVNATTHSSATPIS